MGEMTTLPTACQAAWRAMTSASVMAARLSKLL